MNSKTQKVIRLKGEITDLKPLGWRFNKLFARNYICYSFGYCQHSTQLWFYKHLGGYLEIRDLGNNSHIIFDYIASGEYKKTQRQGVFGGLFTPSRRLNLTTGELEAPNATNSVLYYMGLCDKKGEDYDTPEHRVNMDKIDENYIEVTFPENLIKAIEQFKHLFEVREETSK